MRSSARQMKNVPFVPGILVEMETNYEDIILRFLS